MAEVRYTREELEAAGWRNDLQIAWLLETPLGWTRRQLKAGLCEPRRSAGRWPTQCYSPKAIEWVESQRPEAYEHSIDDLIAAGWETEAQLADYIGATEEWTRIRIQKSEFATRWRGGVVEGANEPIRHHSPKCRAWLWSQRKQALALYPTISVACKEIGCSDRWLRSNLKKVLNGKPVDRKPSGKPSEHCFVQCISPEMTAVLKSRWLGYSPLDWPSLAYLERFTGWTDRTITKRLRDRGVEKRRFENPCGGKKVIHFPPQATEVIRQIVRETSRSSKRVSPRVQPQADEARLNGGGRQRSHDGFLDSLRHKPQPHRARPGWYTERQLCVRLKRYRDWVRLRLEELDAKSLAVPMIAADGNQYDHYPESVYEALKQMSEQAKRRKAA